MTDITLNQNIAECLRETTNFTETVVTNICNGTVTHIANGTAGTTGIILLIGIGVFALFAFTAMFISIMRDR
jgi:hypothetical protein